jgi:DNA invertase Pin-like site-specific DNA recombinase
VATYGYGRVSKDSQSSENQKQLIETQLKMPLDFWYEDHATSGSIKAADRKMFSKMASEVVAGDTIVFSRVDRISRKTSDVLNTVEGLLARGVEVYILQVGKEPLSSPMGKVILGVFAIFAENERLSIVDRTNSGLARVIKEGRILGPRLKIDPITLGKLCEGRKQYTLDKLSAMYSLDRNTISQNVKKWESKLGEYEVEWSKRELQYAKSE